MILLAHVLAQDQFPDRPIKAMGVTIVVKNKPGAGTTPHLAIEAFSDKESGWDTTSESPFGIGGPKGMDPTVVKGLDKFFQTVICMNSADHQAYGERTFRAEKATIERLGLVKKA